MKLSIIGRPLGAGVNQFLLREAAKFYLDILMKADPRRMDTISLEIKLETNLSVDLKNDAMAGWLDDRYRPNKFFIDMDADLSYRGALIALAHELTHVKQMALGERQESWDGLTMRWFGMPYDPSTMHYYDLPWEIEAHGREYGLYDRYVQSIRNVELPPATTIDPEKQLRVA